MVLKVVEWDNKYAKKQLKAKLQDCMSYRKAFEKQWAKNEATIFNQDGLLDIEGGGVSINDLASFIDVNSDETIGVNYTFKNYRLIHSQLSANPPTVIVRPTSSDIEDRRSADAADRLVRHAIRHYKMQENIDQVTSKALLYGTGWMKTTWDKEAGEMIGLNERTGELHMEGDINIEPCSTWDVFIDPIAKRWEEVRYIIERKWMTKEEAKMRFGKHADKVISSSAKSSSTHIRQAFKNRNNLEDSPVYVFCYWEKGMPINGMGGRYCEFLEDGTVIGDLFKNPFAFRNEDEDKDSPLTAHLPFHILTDIDVADQVYGKSFIEYDVEIQHVVNQLDNLTLDNVANHGAFRMILPEGAEIAEDSVTDSPREVIKVTGNQGPHYISPAQSPADMSHLRDRLVQGIDSMAGVNESMFGQQSREQSGFSMQYATNQGNMIRRRLFNKYVMMVESTYRGYLNLIRQNWKVPQIVLALGKEKAFESVHIIGADIDSGFDIVVEYGASLSLDPNSRRQEIMQMMPIFEKYGIDGKTIVRMLKLNELEGLYDINDMGRERQQEVFEEMINSDGDLYIAPYEMQEHDSMLAYGYEFLMSAAYRDLPDRVKDLIKKHIKDREELKAKSLGTPDLQGGNVGNNPPGPGGGLGSAPGAPPGMPPGMPAQI